MREKPDSIAAFVRTGIWFLPEEGLSRSKAFVIRSLKILLLAIRGYQRDRCAIKASALTFHTLLSVVPVIAVFFGIAKGFGATQWLYVSFQVGVAKANAVYGSFAALPLFLVWIQLSWLIVLMGSEISFAVQNVDTHGFPEGSERVSPRHKKILSLLIARLVFRNFSAGEKPLTPSRIANALGMPSLLVRRILADFSAAGLLSAVKTEEGEEAAYQPAPDIRGITVNTVLDALERGGPADLPFPLTGDFRAISDILDAFGKAIGRSPEIRLITEL